MSMVTSSQDTCGRLLAAAIEVFTDVGYREATLRAICQRAGANNAAVNYHFRDKEHLYLAVIEHAIETMQGFRSRAQTDPSASPEDRLGRFIHSILTDLLGEGPPTWLMKLVAREIAEPTAGLDLLVEKVIVPLEAELRAIVRDLAGPAATEQQVQDCAASVFAQCHQYHHDRTVVFRLGRYTAYDPATIDHLADHITSFSLAGIHAVAAR
jgi:TetR/AcrR family transcriptional regulator, regulator of cefoperazone and chloramphenicol sensitivity